jgi:hypothetical protein
MPRGSFERIGKYQLTTEPRSRSFFIWSFLLKIDRLMSVRLL